MTANLEGAFPREAEPGRACRVGLEELTIKHGRNYVAELTKSWYGLQDASHIWQQHYTDLFMERQFQ